MVNKKSLKIIYNGFINNLMCAVTRTAVRVDYYSLLIRKVLCKACLNSPYNMSDGIGIVKTRDSDKNVGFSDFFQLFSYLVS